MFRVIVSCKGISIDAATSGVADIAEEFLARPWHSNVLCYLDGERVILQADNDFDSDGQALLDEFSDAVCACIPIENTTISFAVESVSLLTSTMSN